MTLAFDHLKSFFSLRETTVQNAKSLLKTIIKPIKQSASTHFKEPIYATFAPTTIICLTLLYDFFIHKHFSFMKSFPYTVMPLVSITYILSDNHVFTDKKQLRILLWSTFFFGATVAGESSLRGGHEPQSSLYFLVLTLLSFFGFMTAFIFSATHKLNVSKQELERELND